LVGAALTAPWLYLLAQWSAAQTSWELAEYLARHPFHRYFNRAFQLFALLGIWWVLKNSGIRSLNDLGIRRSHAFLDLSFGFLSSCIFIATYLIILKSLHILQFKDAGTVQTLLRVLPSVLLTGAVVSILEEVFFRGYFYRVSTQTLSQNLAILLNALFFASVHYLRPYHVHPSDHVNWLSGFQHIGQSSLFSGPYSEILGGLGILIFIALFLCKSVNYYQSIFHAIGLHAGWIVMLQTSSEIFVSRSSAPTWLLGGGNLSQGILSAIPIAFQFGWFLWFRSKRTPSST
jgi:membrane protease YdiL (CAAX protease family)